MVHLDAGHPQAFEGLDKRFEHNGIGTNDAGMGQRANAACLGDEIKGFLGRQVGFWDVAWDEEFFKGLFGIIDITLIE